MSKLRDKALNALDVKRENVKVEEWDNAEFEIRGLGMFAYNTLVRECSENGDLVAEKFYPALIIETAHDPESGGKVFTKTDRDALGAKSTVALSKLVNVGLKLCGADGESVRKNSETIPQEDISSE